MVTALKSFKVKFNYLKVNCLEEKRVIFLLVRNTFLCASTLSYRKDTQMILKVFIQV
jgi:hypothetical protein